MTLWYPVRDGERGGRHPPGSVVHAVIVRVRKRVEMLHASTNQTHGRTLSPTSQKCAFVLTAEFPYQQTKKSYLVVRNKKTKLGFGRDMQHPI